MEKINYVMSSPLRRCLQTTVFSFNPLFTKDITTGVPTENATIIVWPDLRELGNDPCNISLGRGAVKQVTAKQNIPVNLSLLIGEDWVAIGDQPGARAKRVRDGLYEFQKAALLGRDWKDINLGGRPAREDVHVVLVAHGNLLSEVLGYPPGVNKFDNTWVRTSVFESRVLTKSKAGTPDLVEPSKNKWQGEIRKMAREGAAEL